MKHVEEDKKNVEMVCVKEEFKHFSPNTTNARCPHHQQNHKRDLSSYIGYISRADQALSAKRAIETWPSQMWYLMLDSDVRPTRGKIDDPRVTGKNRNAQHVFPRYASLREMLRNFPRGFKK